MLNFNEFQATARKIDLQNGVDISQKDATNSVAQKQYSAEEVLKTNPSQVVISKSQLAKTIGIIGLLSGSIMFAIGRGKKTR